LQALRAQGVKTACYFPDGHPHAYGRALKDALSEYDLIISAKADHPARWSAEFGYSNRCVHVPHGYDADLHLAADIAHPEEQTADIAMVATARDEYFTLLQQMVEAAPEIADRQVVIGGPGWSPYRAALPSGWQFPGPQNGAQYARSLRSARIAVAPVQRTVRIAGQEVAYDSDTARTYELAAMGVFFVHRHSDLMPQIFDPATEVPLFRDGAELAQLAQRYLDAPQERMKMARALRARAVPAYSWDARAAGVAEHLRALVGQDMPQGQQTA
jgi:glycosyltransferase involved in cell wall biosynthesis